MDIDNPDGQFYLKIGNSDAWAKLEHGEVWNQLIAERSLPGADPSVKVEGSDSIDKWAKPQTSLQAAEMKSADALDELNNLIGLSEVKREVIRLKNFMTVQLQRKAKGFATPPISLHLCFTGNPGTGKTTVAKIIGAIYRNLGLLAKGHVIATDQSGLVEGYVSATPKKTMQKIAEAEGGVLFIDEAYALLPEEGSHSFGSEAINTLVLMMEEWREKLCVIVAGYPEPMERFISSNDGLRSRFTKIIHFPDYNGDELMRIFTAEITKHGYQLSPEANALARKFTEYHYQHRERGFGNARDMRNFAEQLYQTHSERVISESLRVDSPVEQADVLQAAQLALRISAI